MRTQGDIKRRRSVKAEFDPDFSATALGGAVLVEKAGRSLGLRRLIGRHLAQRRAAAWGGYSTVDGVYALVVSLVAGGRGIKACEFLREDPLAREVFGLAEGAPSDSTLYRILCDLSGLVERSAADWYKPSGPALVALRLDGGERRLPRRRRLVPAAPEEAEPEPLAALDALVGASAVRCAAGLEREEFRVHGWWVAHGDATDVEVGGQCFDAAEVGREGERALRWHTLRLGPLIVAQALGPGNADEGRRMPGLLERGRPVIREIAGRHAKVLVLLDAAYCEGQVVDGLSAAPYEWDWIVCANQHRAKLTEMAAEQPELIWKRTGPDARRGWVESQVGCFTHLFEGWSAPVTIVARRWREEGDLPHVWRTSFLATRIEPEHLPGALRKRLGYESAIWALYGTKQGRENDYKTPLCDMGLHHPPSGRLGVSQAFYAIASVAANLAMALRYGAVDKRERGIELWRLRERYLRIAGYLVRSGQTLLVRLSGVAVDALRQTLWRNAFAAAGRL